MLEPGVAVPWMHARCPGLASLRATVPAILLLTLADTTAQAWQTSISGNVAGSYDTANAVAVDDAGNVYAAGYVEDFAFGTRVTVVKLDREGGRVLWRRELGPAGQNSQRLVVDRNQDVVVTAGGFPIVAKLSGATGSEMWYEVESSDVSPSPALLPRALTTDARGDVVIAGLASKRDSPQDFGVAKFDGATGTLLWRRAIEGEAQLGDEALAVAIDASGDVVAGGYVTDEPRGATAFAVVKLRGTDGTVVWKKTVVATMAPTARARAVAVAPSGDVIAMGWTANASSTMTVMRLARENGVEMWRRDIVGMVYASDTGRAMVLDEAGDVVVAGSGLNPQPSPTNPMGFDYLVTKLAGSTGAEVWRAAVTGSAPNSGDEPNAVAVSVRGDVFVAGPTTNLGAERVQFTVVKLDGATGGELWRRLAIAASSGQGFATAIAVDREGGAAVAGQTTNAGTAIDFTVMRLDGLTGELGQATVIPSPCTVDTECDDRDACTADGCAGVSGCYGEERNPDRPRCYVANVAIAAASMTSLLRQSTPADVGSANARRLVRLAKHYRRRARVVGRERHIRRGDFKPLSRIWVALRRAILRGIDRRTLDPRFAVRLLEYMAIKGTPGFGCGGISHAEQWSDGVRAAFCRARHSDPADAAAQ